MAQVVEVQASQAHLLRAQTIVQTHLYGGAVRWFAEPGVVEGIPPNSWRSLASRAVAEATSGVAGPGPVHLNLAFRDPLVAEPDRLPEGRPDFRAWHRAERAPATPSREFAAELHGRRGVIVAGRRCGRTSLHHLAEALGWPVLADARSLARGTPDGHPPRSLREFGTYQPTTYDQVQQADASPLQRRCR